MQPTVHRYGFTLFETVVVIGIVAFLIGLVGISIQSARESSRRLSCQSNLHQVGIGMANFVGSSGVFPSLLANRSSKGDQAFDQTAYVALMPFLETKQDDERAYASTVPELDLPPSIFRCPSSNEYLAYRFSFGSGLGIRTELDGVMRIFKGISPAEITDGLSNTVVISERVCGNFSNKPFAVVSLSGYPDADSFVRDCEQTNNPTGFVRELGMRWRGHQPVDVGYSHYARPNNVSWDCQGGGQYQLVSARSYHSGGVLTQNADGSVRWISSNIDAAAWKALGTIAGHETLRGE